MSADGAQEEIAKSRLDVILPTPKTRPTVLLEETAIEDDRNEIRPGDPVLLIVEDDVTFAQILLDMAHDRGLKAVVALQGARRSRSPGSSSREPSLSTSLSRTRPGGRCSTG